MKKNTKHQQNQNKNKTKIIVSKILIILKKTDPTEQELKGSSRINNLYQNTTNKIQLPKEKVWTISLLLESLKRKDFQSPDLEIDFLLDSGEESNIKNIPT